MQNSMQIKIVHFRVPYIYISDTKTTTKEETGAQRFSFKMGIVSPIFGQMGVC